MPPRKAKQNLSTASNEDIENTAIIPKPSTMERTLTPEHDPSKKAPISLTQVQKQVLIDNLQQEVTDRARRLRTQYAQQAQNLRSRLEMRINRIPMALRKRKMQDLIDEHTRRNEPQPAAPLPAQASEVAAQATESSTSNKKLKRSSDQIVTTEEDDQHDLSNPKKRAKTATNTANTKAARATAEKTAPSVLSPRSHNSRAQPKAAGKASDKALTSHSRPASPIKSQPSVPARSGRVQTKRNADNGSRNSDASNTSASTTIVNKVGRGGRAAATTAKKLATATSKATAAAKKTVGMVKKENVPPTTAAGGRCLRKRA